MRSRNMSVFLMPESSRVTDYPAIMRNNEDEIISLECLEKLGLEENPFVDHARDPFLYIDDQLEMSINVLIDYLLNQNSTLVILGEIGIGKTTLLRLLLRKGYQNFNFCTLRAKNNLTFEEIEEKIKQRWSLGRDNSSDELTTDEYIKQFIEGDKCPVLVIDDAHRLDTRSLDLLFQLKHRVGLQSSSTLGLILSSEPTIQPRISELEQSNPAATHIYQTNVRTFDNTQCEKYINYRLQKAGCDDADFFDEETHKKIYETSSGLPRVINKLSRIEITKKCTHDPAKIYAATEDTSTPNTKIIGMLALGLLGLLGLAALIFAFMQKSDDADVVNELEIIQTDVIKAETKEEVDIEEEIIQEESKNITKPYVAPLVLGKLKLDEIKEKESDSNTQTVKENNITKPKKDVQQKEIVNVKAGSVKDEIAKENVSTQTSASKKVDNTGNKKVQVESNLPIGDAKLHAPSWLLEQSAEAYTVQIVASPSEQNLTAFNDKHFKNQQTAYYKKQSDDKQWYVLVYGIYATREEAIAVIENMPEPIKKNKPYPLQLKFIQELIQN